MHGPIFIHKELIMKLISINARLRAGMAAIVVFFVAQAVLIVALGRVIEKDVVATAYKNTLAATALNDLAVLAQQVRRYEKEYFIYVAHAEKRLSYESEWTSTAGRISNGLQAMLDNKQEALSRAALVEVSKWMSAAEFYKTEMNKVFEQVRTRANGTALDPRAPMYAATEVNDMIKEGKDRLSNDLVKGVAKMSAEKSKATLALSDLAAQGFDQMVYGVLITVLAGIAIAVRLIVTLPRSVLRPIDALTETVDALSKGNNEVAVGHGGTKEFEGLAKAVDRMRVAQGLLLQRLRNRV